MSAQPKGADAVNVDALPETTATQAAFSSTPSLPRPRDHAGDRRGPANGRGPEAEQLLDALGVRGRIRRLSQIGKGIPDQRVELRGRAIPHLATAAAAGANTWHSVSEFGTSGHGNAANVVAVNALTLDLDDDKVRGGRPGVERLLDEISDLLGVKPRAVVDSGHGLQPHYAIDDTLARWEPGDTETRQQWVDAFEAVHRAIRHIAAENGGDLDTVDGIERLWRMPGSTNTKPGREPIAAQLVSIVPDSDSLSLADLRDAARSVLIEKEQLPATSVPRQEGAPAIEGTQLQRWARAAVDGELVGLRASHDWPEGYRDNRGINPRTGKPFQRRGWEKLISDAANRCGAVLKVPDTCLDPAQVRQQFLDAAPRGGDINDRWLAEKWDTQTQRAAPATPPINNRFMPGLTVTTAPVASDDSKSSDDVVTGEIETLAAWQVLRRDYHLDGPQRVPLSEIFETETDAKGNQRVSGRLLVETCARYLDQGFAQGGDRRLHVYRDGVFAADDEEVKRRVVWLLGEQYSPNRYRAIADIVSVQPHPLIPDVPDQRFINVTNGMVEIASGKLLPHDPAYLSTVQLPVEYTPGATCPRFDTWVAQVVPPDTVEMFWEVLGYLLLHGNPLQVAMLLHGAGGNGKGTLLRVLHQLLGRHNVSAVTLQEITDGKFEVAAMYGKQANIAGDIDPRFLKNTAKFKAITGGDVINAQHKNQQPFEFTCWAVPIFSANELWRSADVSVGYFRRWVPLPFPTSVVDSSAPFREEVLYEETAGIFAKALPALGALLRRGRFELSRSSRDLLQSFRQQADSVLSWIDEDDQVTVADPSRQDVTTARNRLHVRYSTWCTVSGHVALSTTKFYARLDGLAYQQMKTQGTRCYRGLGLAFS